MGPEEYYESQTNNVQSESAQGEETPDSSRVVTHPARENTLYVNPELLREIISEDSLGRVIEGSSDREINAPEHVSDEEAQEKKTEAAIQKLFDEKTPLEIARLLNKGCDLPLEYGQRLQIHGLATSVLVDGTNDKAVQLAIKYLARCVSDDQKKVFLRIAFERTVFNTDGNGNPSKTTWSANPSIDGVMRRLMESPEVSRVRWIWFGGRLSEVYFVRQTTLALEDLQKIAQASLERGAQYTNRHGIRRDGASLIQAEKTLLRYYELLSGIDNVSEEFVKEKDAFVRAMRERQSRFAEFWDKASIGGDAQKAVSIELTAKLPAWIQGQLSDKFNSRSGSVFVGTQSEINSELEKRRKDLGAELTDLISNYEKNRDADEIKELSELRTTLLALGNNSFTAKIAPFFVRFNQQFVKDNESWLKDSEFKLNRYTKSNENSIYGAVALDFDSARELYEKFAEKLYDSANLWFDNGHQEDIRAVLDERLGLLQNRSATLEAENNVLNKEIEVAKGTKICDFEGGELRAFREATSEEWNITWWSPDGKVAHWCARTGKLPSEDDLKTEIGEATSGGSTYENQQNGDPHAKGEGVNESPSIAETLRARILAALENNIEEPSESEVTPNLKAIREAQNRLAVNQSSLDSINSEIAEETGHAAWYDEFSHCSIGGDGFTPALTKLLQVDKEFRINGILHYVDVNSSGKPWDYIEGLPQEQRAFASERVFRWYDLRDRETKISLGLQQDDNLYRLNKNIPRDNQLSLEDAEKERQKARKAARSGLNEADELVAKYFEKEHREHTVAVAWLQDKAGNRITTSGNRGISNRVVEKDQFLKAYNDLQNIAIKKDFLNKQLNPDVKAGQRVKWGIVRETEKEIAAAESAARNQLKLLFPDMPDRVELHPKLLTCHGSKDVSIVIANVTARNEDIQSAAGALDALARFGHAITAQKKVLGYLAKDKPFLDRMTTLKLANSIRSFDRPDRLSDATKFEEVSAVQ